MRPEGEQRDEASIYLDLCRRSGVPLFGSRIAQAVFGVLKGVATLFGRRGQQPALPQQLLLSLLLKLCGQVSFRKLLRSPRGVLREPHRSDDFLGKRITTDDKRVDLASPVLLNQAVKLDADFEREKQNAPKLKLIGRRAVGTHNSWTHNLEAFAQPGTNYLYVHPNDAQRLGLTEGALADVASGTSTVRVPVKLLADLMPGTVALPHGWGHQHATGLSVASRTRGVNVNLLAADGPERIERVSGMAHLTGMLVDVRPAAGPQDAGSWSGLPESEHALSPAAAK